jgi:hypothetical protein
MTNKNIQLLEFLLSQSENVPLSRLSKEMNVSKRQVQRYLAELKKINPDLETIRAGTKGSEETCYRISIDHVIDSPGLTSNQFNQLMDMLDNYSDVDSKLRGKLLYILSKARFAAFYLSDNEKKIRECITKKKILKIKTYYHRDKESGPLLLKPVRLDSFNGRVYAYQQGEDISRVNKYNLELMDIEEHGYMGEQFDSFKETGIKLFNPFKKELDPFGFYLKDKKYNVVLHLKPFAYSQLFRQFSHLMAYVNRLENPVEGYLYKLEMTVFDIQPIARFVTGLLNEIKIIGPENFKDELLFYIEKRVLEGLKRNYFEYYEAHIK